MAGAIFIGAFMAFTAVGVDLGRLAYTATEVQTVADAAAVAGARTLLDNFRSGGAADPVDAALVVGGQNPVDGGAPNLRAGDVEVGHFDGQTRTFSSGGVPQNAVRVTSRATVQNIVAGIFGAATSTVTRQAIAAYSGSAGGYPTLPIAVGECKFNAYQRSGRCSDLPSLSLAPDPSDNSGWTSLSSDPASASEAMRFLPGSCGGGGLEPPLVVVNQQINVMNGSATTILQTLDQCVRQGLREYQIPIVACGGATRFNQAMEVLGFAKVTISHVEAQSNPKGIDLSAICEIQPATGVGGGDFGAETVALVG